MQADVILKEPPPMSASCPQGGTRNGGRGDRPPPLRTPLRIGHCHICMGHLQ